MAVALAAAITVGCHVWLVFTGLVPAMVSRPLHLALALPWVFIIGVNGGWISRGIGSVFCLTGLAITGWIAIDHRRITDQYGWTEGWWQPLVCLALILIVLDLARRAVKWVMPCVAALCLAYAVWGDLIPGEWGHAGIPLEGILGRLVLAEGGLWGSLTGISVDLVAPFLVMGSVVAAGAAGAGFMALATQLAGRYRAGEAKVEVVASALYGTISGSASANVASTGTITIPAMIRSGYPRSFAAAVEAVASTGGQIMPPVMGAGVFLMAELLRVPYAELMVAALLPSVLFFATVWIGIDHFAGRLGLPKLSAADLPGWRRVCATVPFFLCPFLVLLGMLALTDYTAAYAAMLAAGIGVLMLAANGDGRLDIRGWLPRLESALVDGARQIAQIASIILCASLIVGVFNMTGLGVKITSVIVGTSGGMLWAALVLTAVACLVLGMELPTTAAYVICVSVAGPALINLGLPPLQAHMFVFWYALLCTITPPVCGNVFIASTIAQTPWLPVAFRAMRLGLGLFLIPLAFVLNPALLDLGERPLWALIAAVKVAVALWFASYALIAEAPLWRRCGAAALAIAVAGLAGIA
ncbi:MAG: TRAP transporter fused permease subunit [Alphaproteobacteria bacterium]|nr:MAG: TRAP transporter fused permease subunit [Alphaproteobacteria bacterium]